MTLQDFITSYQGKKWDFDGKYSAQCVDLFRFYVKDVLNIPQPNGVTGAKDFWTAYTSDSKLNTQFDRIANTPTGVPTPGDVMIWGSNYGQYGHIAIVTEADVNSFKALSQNDPIGRETHVKSYNYNNVLGWLHPKKGTMANMYKGYDLANPESMKVAVDVLVRLQAGELIEKTKHEQLMKTQLDTLIKEKDVAVADAYARGLKECEAAQPPQTTEPDMSKWELNGMTVQTGNVVRNYKLKA